MIRIADGHLERVLLSVMTSGPGSGIANEPSVFETNIGPASLIASAPAAQADHLVICRPIGEGIIGSVIGDKAASVAHIFLECGLRLFRPLAAATEVAVVGDDNFVGGKIGLERAHVGAFWRRG